MTIDDGCLCHEVMNPWTYHGIVEPGGAMEPNPDCEVHFPKVPKRPIVPARSARETTFSVFEEMLHAGDKNLGVEPIGIVLIYPEQAFLKAVWTDDANREDIAQGLITAATDELSKA